MATLFEYFQAIRDGNAAQVKSCLSSGKWSINFQNAYGQTALHIATIHNKQDMIKLLVRYSAPLDLHDIQGHTPLHIACRNAHFGNEYMDTVKLLLQCGADGTIPSTAAEGELSQLPAYATGRLPIDCAMDRARAEVAELLQTIKKDDEMLSTLKSEHADLVMREQPSSSSETIPTASVPATTPPPAAEAAPEVTAVIPSEPEAPLDLNALPKDVLMFVGQGTQFVGMARDIIESNGPGKELFDRAFAILGYDLGKLCLEGPADRLTSTAFSQPAVMVSSLAALAEFKQRNPDFMERCGHFAGFSLGEITALVAAGLVSFEDGLKLVKIRAEAMQLASEEHPGGMGSITGLSDDVLDLILKEVRKETGSTVEIANYLFPKGRVVSGEHAAVELVCKKAEAKGAISAKKLVVGGAFHTEFMALAQKEISKALDSIAIKSPRCAVYSNVTGKPYQTAQEIRDLLIRQVISPVQWEETAKTLASLGGKIYEVGAGEQLKAMMRRIDMGAWQRVENIGHWMPPRA